MHYEINVALNGSHLFATHKRSLTNEQGARECFALFAQKFPASEGYSLELTRWDTQGYFVAKQERETK
jgi:hypothetical protein